MHLYQRLFHPGGGLPIISRILQISFPAGNQGTTFSYNKMFSLYSIEKPRYISET